MQKVAHIVGAGISGLSAAVRLANANFKVCLYEATQQAGGRCRSYFDAATNLTIDNGNHLLLSGNRHASGLCEVDRHRSRAGGTEARPVSLCRCVDRQTLAARSRRQPPAAMGVRFRATGAGHELARLSGADAADLVVAFKAGRRRHSLRGRAVPAIGAAAAFGRAQCRSARRIGRPCRRGRAGDAARGRAGLPAVDCARGPERGPGRAGDQAVAGQGRRYPVWPGAARIWQRGGSGERAEVRRRGHFAGPVGRRRVGGAAAACGLVVAGAEDAVEIPRHRERAFSF